MSLITAEGDAAIRSFKYKGGDLSLSYNYIWSPLAEQVLRIMPPSVAPNTITLVGFLAHVIGTLVLISQGSFGSAAPGWALALYGITVFVYQTLDNVDGKQARKIGNSTPLGMIMDHGCDALGLIFLSIGMSRIMCLDDFELILWVFTYGVTFAFYISAWAQYHSQGIMILGKFNAVDDGIPIIWMLALFCSVFGQDFFKTQFSLFGTTHCLNAFIAKAIAWSGLLQAYSLKQQAGDKFTKQVGKALLDLGHEVMVCAVIGLISMKSNLCSDYFPQIFVGVGFMMARTISYTLLCSVTEMKFKQFQPSVLVFNIGYAILVFFGDRLPVAACVYAITAFVIAEYFYFVTAACQHIAKTLNIRIFHVFDPKQVKKE